MRLVALWTLRVIDLGIWVAMAGLGLASVPVQKGLDALERRKLR
jgi:hypothetical protein